MSFGFYDPRFFKSWDKQSNMAKKLVKMLLENCQIDQSAMTVADWSIPYGWPCIDGKICNGNFITGPYWNAQYKKNNYMENIPTSSSVKWQFLLSLENWRSRSVLFISCPLAGLFAELHICSVLFNFQYWNNEKAFSFMAYCLVLLFDLISNIGPYSILQKTKTLKIWIL